mmetsp:Transcript_78397/g.201878  ORF Transcript_78397/g.201878 Transcript_78397/m.201878 type:complete len:213 (+) Transcript_78397:554-1192(+)
MLMPRCLFLGTLRRLRGHLSPHSQRLRATHLASCQFATRCATGTTAWRMIEHSARGVYPHRGRLVAVFNFHLCCFLLTRRDRQCLKLWLATVCRVLARHEEAQIQITALAEEVLMREIKHLLLVVAQVLACVWSSESLQTRQDLRGLRPDIISLQEPLCASNLRADGCLGCRVVHGSRPTWEILGCLEQGLEVHLQPGELLVRIAPGGTHDP